MKEAKTQSGKTFCFPEERLSILNFVLRVTYCFLRTVDLPTTNFFGMHCYFPVFRLVNFVKWPRLHQSHCKTVQPANVNILSAKNLMICFSLSQLVFISLLSSTRSQNYVHQPLRTRRVLSSFQRNDGISYRQPFATGFDTNGN